MMVLAVLTQATLVLAEDPVNPIGCCYYAATDGMSASLLNVGQKYPAATQARINSFVKGYQVQPNRKAQGDYLVAKLDLKTKNTWNHAAESLSKETGIELQDAQFVLSNLTTDNG